MFALPTYVSGEQRPSSGLAQARLRFSQGCLGFALPIMRCGTTKINLTRNYQLLTRGLFRPSLARDPKYITTYTVKIDTRDYNLR